MSYRRFTIPAVVLAVASALLANGCAMETESVEATGGTLDARPYFEVFEGRDGQHYFHLSAANHEIMMQSEGYSSRTSALNGVLSVLDHGEDFGNYELRFSSIGSWYYVLTARNGAVLAVSEQYSSRSAAERAVASAVRNVGDYLTYLAHRRGARFDVFQGADGDYYFNLHAGNGEIVLSSQGYGTEAAAYNATFSVADNGVLIERYDVREAANGGWYFNLKARNGRVIGTSEVYTTRYGAERACDSIAELLPSVDLL